MQKSIQAIRGMNDILPKDTACWQYVEDVLRRVATNYAYQEIRFPVVEATELFKRTIGEVTDIVAKEMYTFEDKNGNSLTLRPEGTAGCVRAGIEKGLLYNQTCRLWYSGPMFRHERPQKGRYRQFYQFGLEAFGFKGPDIDGEQILLMARVWEELGIADQLELQINSLGSKATRAKYRKALVDYFKQHESILDKDSEQRLTSNPLRILDSKNPDMQQLIKKAPKMLDFLSAEEVQHFARFKDILDENRIKYVITPHLVRGLDYYNLTVCEWVTDKLGAQGTVCAGGRYDDLVGQLGGTPTFAVGCALGMERLIELVRDKLQQTDSSPHAYVIMVGEEAETKGMQLAEQLRTKLPALRLQINCGEGNFTAQFKRADKSGAKYALILGNDELRTGKVSVKYLREDRKQQSLKPDKLIKVLCKLL